MILADKIMEERKRIGWSQEELAEQLDVSRQSVSKWEGAQSVPDINKIIKMAELFGVSTDYLLKDDAVRENENIVIAENVEKNREVRRVSMEEASEFIEIKKKYAPQISLAVSMCIGSPILLIVLCGMAESKLLGISENIAAGAGVIILLLMVACAVGIFVKTGSILEKYEFFEKVEIETEYGVDGMAKEKRAAFEGTYSRCVTIGVILCILCSVPLLLSIFLTEEAYIITGMVGVLLLIVAVAVNLFVRVGIEKESFDMLLQEGDYSVVKKSAGPLMGRIAKIYWLTAVAIYLAISLPTDRWEISWVIWPVAGVLYAVVITIVKIITKAEE